MTVYVSKKTSWLRCLVSFLLAAGTAALFFVLFEGPRLGPLYDFLLRRRPAVPVSRELLIIDSSGLELGDDILEPGAAASLLYTMTELGARTLIIQVPILGLSAGGSAGEDEILYRFDEEFAILSRNIRNLFDGIRTGSVSPSESARYVGELVELSDKGKERLVSALVRRDTEGIAGMEKAAAFFGHARRPGDLRVQLIRTGEGERPGVLAAKDEYSRARPDRDGVLRRIAPILTVPGLLEGEAGERTLEHIIYGALKTRFNSAGIEYGGYPVLAARGGPDGTDRIIPLDRGGAVLFEIPRKNEGFRRIGILDFLAYDEADRSLRRLLLEGEALGIFQYIEGENHPGFLYDYALSLREELAASTAAEDRKQDWIEARNRYFASLEQFLYGPTEMNLVGGYEEIIASGGEGSAEKMTEMRDTLIRTFVALRDRYNEVSELREKLTSALSFSFCILGRGSAGVFDIAETRLSRPRFFSDGPVGDMVRAVSAGLRSAFFWTNPSDAEASALLANSILTGRVVKPGNDRYLLLGALLSALLICVALKSRNPVSTLGIAAALILLVGLVFSLGFILSGIWLNPLVPVAAAFAGALVSFVWALIARIRYARRFRQAFGPSVSRSCLRSVIREGKPLPAQVQTLRAAVVAVKITDDAGNSPGLSPRAILGFQEKVSELFRKAGGTITAADGDMVTACFGSPLERVFLGGKRKVSPYEDNIHAKAAPAQRAVDIVSGIARHPEYASWHFGLDTGDCTFAWTAVSGYFALGAPVQKARILSRLAGRYGERIVISNAVNEALPDEAAKKLDTLKGKDGTGGEPFYRLAT